MKFHKVKIVTTMLLASTAILGIADKVLAVDGGDLESSAVVKFKPDDSTTSPIDPENPGSGGKVDPFDPSTPDNKPKPGTAGPLSLDFVSSLDFGMNKITDKDMTYNSEAQYYRKADGSRDLTNPKPSYVQVTDKRGANSGWTLTVTQKEQLTSENGKLLEGAVIKFTKGNVVQGNTDIVNNAIIPTSYAIELTPGKSTKVMDASEGQGMYTWINSWGDSTSFTDGVAMDESTEVKRNPAITLFVPGKTIKEAALYRSELIWSLNDTPGNGVVNPGE